jgi:hypothetical protein
MIPAKRRSKEGLLPTANTLSLLSSQTPQEDLKQES